MKLTKNTKPTELRTGVNCQREEEEEEEEGMMMMMMMNINNSSSFKKRDKRVFQSLFYYSITAV
jgi:hypothetical protein